MARITSASKFSFGTYQHSANALDFWSWAFADINVPVVRGVLIEYLVSNHLLSNALQIAGRQISVLTHDDPTQPNYAKNLNSVYNYQPHGDTIDLQLQWGLTIEFKSTQRPDSWTINKTKFWNALQDKDLTRKSFQAQFYVLANIDKILTFTNDTLNFGEVEFFLLSGADLEQEAGQDASVSFNKFTALARKNGHVCTFTDLVPTLKKMVEQRLTHTRTNLPLTWKIPKTTHKNRSPWLLAVETNGNVTTGYYCPTNKTLLESFIVPWNTNFSPTWRDWEAVGLKYVPEQ